jgi:predicted extracellular nuclease
MHRALATALVALALVLALVAASGAGAGPSPDIVVSQLYAGGGNSGASFANDFIELFNRGGTAVDVGGWTIQYASAAGTSWQATALAGTIPAGAHYLVQLGSGGTAGSPLPGADTTGTTNLANSGGKVALVRAATALACGASAGSCSADPLVADLVGYGSATDYEGAAAAPALANTTADVRGGNGCSDSDDNAGDFATATPDPRSSSAATAPCGAAPPPAGSVAQSAAVDVDIQPVLSIALERSTVSFGNAVAGDTPAPVSEHVTVLSNNAGGYALTVHRSAFQPGDLPLGIAVGGGAIAPIPIPPASDLLVGTNTGRSADGGDVWATSLGFVSPLPTVAAGHYTATVTFTVFGR